MDFLDLDVRSQVQIPLRAIIGESIAVLGIKGSGKTNTAAVIIEELLEHGLPLTIVDIEGEYWGLKEKFDVFVIGRSTNVDVPAGVAQAAHFAEFSLKNSVSLILDLSDFDPEEMHEFLLNYFTALWRIAFAVRKPYQVVLEEAHEFVPQMARTPLKEILSRIALRGRKRGLGVISVSQRSAKVEKDILTQAAILFLHRVVHPIDLKVYQEILPLPPREVEMSATNLRAGQALVMVDNVVQAVQIRKRHTFHAGATPELAPTRSPKLKSMNRRLLEQLQVLASRQSEPVSQEAARIQKLAGEIAQKDERIAQQQSEIDRLKTQVELLSKLELSISGEKMPPAPNHLSTLSVDTLHAQNLAAPVVTRNIPSSMPETQADSIAPSAQGQQRRFEHLLRDIAQLPKFHRLMLAFLVEREGTFFSVSELGKWLHLSQSTIINRPPLDLIKMGLIMRTGSPGKRCYQASARQAFSAHFASLNVERLLEQLLHVARSTK